MRCRACEFDNSGRASYCARCGVALTVSCGVCGAHNAGSHVYCSSCGSRLADADGSGSAAPGRPAAERRQLTVMFVDLVGSAALSTQLDAEDFGRLVRRYRMVCAAAAQEHGGYVVQYAGDGVVVYFGYPDAREEAAEQAIRAALKAVAAVGRLSFAGRMLAARVGISTGTVVIDPTGAAAALDQSVFGDTPNLAARLQSLAATGSVVVGDSTRRIVRGAFRYADLGLHELKGFPEPLRVWQVLEESSAESRFDARQAEGMTPLVNRETELAALRDLWDLATRRSGQVVLLSGEPGIGKSRLLREFVRRAEETPHTCLQFQCSPRHADSPLYPVVATLGRVMDVAPGDSDAEKLRKVESFVDAGSGRVDDAVPLLAALLHVSLDERYRKREIASPKDREELLAVLEAELLAGAAQAPLMLIFEDVQWMDPSTGAVLQALVEKVAGEQVMVLVTYRTSFSPPWPAGGPHVTVLPLAGLSEDHSAALVRQVAASGSVPEAIAARIVEKTAGVPLFIEEVTRNVVEAHQTEADGTVPVSVPTTLRDSLMARLDRYRTPKTVAQVAAVLGTTFGYPLLKAVAGLEEDVLRPALDQLLAGRILQRHQVGGEDGYEFRHALIREVAYEAVLRSQRRSYHARAAEVLEARANAHPGAEPEVVAHHYSLAEMPVKAAGHWLRAGTDASHRSANVEAVAHLRRALDELAAVPQEQDQAECRALELKIRIALGAPLIAVSGWAAPEVEATHVRARTLCDLVGSLRERFDVNRGLFNVFVLRGQLAEALRVGEELLAMTETADDRALYLETWRVLGVCAFLGGRFGECRERMEEAIQLYSPEEHHAHTFIYGANPQIVAGCWRSWTDCFLGFPIPAQKRIDDVVRHAERIDHPFSLGYALCFAASIAQTRGEPTIALGWANAALDLALRHHHRYWKAWASIVRGWAMARLGRAADGLEILRTGIADYSATGAEQITGYSTTLLADALRAADDARTARETVERAISMQQPDRVAFYLAEGLRLRAAIREAVDKDQEAVRADLLQAMEVAERQGARLLRVRALRDLATRFGEPYASSPDLATSLGDEPAQRGGGLGGSDIRETA